MSTEKTVQAFNIGANSSSVEVSHLIIALVFAFLFFICAYIIIHLYEELAGGKLKMAKFLQIFVRLFLFLSILGYFLLR